MQKIYCLFGNKKYQCRIDKGLKSVYRGQAFIVTEDYEVRIIRTVWGSSLTYVKHDLGLNQEFENNFKARRKSLNIYKSYNWGENYKLVPITNQEEYDSVAIPPDSKKIHSKAYKVSEMKKYILEVFPQKHVGFDNRVYGDKFVKDYKELKCLKQSLKTVQKYFREAIAEIRLETKPEDKYFLVARSIESGGYWLSNDLEEIDEFSDDIGGRGQKMVEISNHARHFINVKEYKN